MTSNLDAAYIKEKLIEDIRLFIEENYIDETKASKRIIRRSCRAQAEDDLFPASVESGIDEEIEKLLREQDAGFSETLLKLIDKSGKKDSEIYKRANIDRKLFSKIRNNKNYRPSKSTAVGLALALELSFEDASDLIGRAGYAFSKSSEFDLIAEYFFKNKIYDVMELNNILYKFDQSLIGS